MKSKEKKYEKTSTLKAFVNIKYFSEIVQFIFKLITFVYCTSTLLYRSFFFFFPKRFYCSSPGTIATNSSSRASTSSGLACTLAHREEPLSLAKTKQSSIPWKMEKKMKTQSTDRPTTKATNQTGITHWCPKENNNRFVVRTDARCFMLRHQLQKHRAGMRNLNWSKAIVVVYYFSFFSCSLLFAFGVFQNGSRYWWWNIFQIL